LNGVPDRHFTENNRIHIKKPIETSLLTGGADKPYSLALASALLKRGIRLDFIGSNEVSSPDLIQHPSVNFLNLRGDQSSSASRTRKLLRVFLYYLRLIRYAAKSKPKIFHILWNNKVETFDRTILLLYYKLLGKRILFTAHNVNAGKRDGTDSWLNRWTLAFQYRTVDRIFVHTEKMKIELMKEFNVPARKVVIIPFGINTTIPNTGLTKEQARRQLRIDPSRKILLFFGHIAPYKGLEYLIDAFKILKESEDGYHLIIAGKPKNCASYWRQIELKLKSDGIMERTTLKTDYVADEEVERYFKAADVLVLPYTFIFQSGVLLLSYGFGLPVVAADVGSLKQDVLDGKTGFVFKSKDSLQLAVTLNRYFQSGLYKSQDTQKAIRQFAENRYSWSRVAELTYEAYARVQSTISN
jgi:D-inositol-3-phosphate glycosyltransferase